MKALKDFLPGLFAGADRIPFSLVREALKLDDFLAPCDNVNAWRTLLLLGTHANMRPDNEKSGSIYADPRASAYNNNPALTEFDHRTYNPSPAIYWVRYPVMNAFRIRSGEQFHAVIMPPIPNRMAHANRKGWLLYGIKGIIEDSGGPGPELFRAQKIVMPVFGEGTDIPTHAWNLGLTGPEIVKSLHYARLCREQIFDGAYVTARENFERAGNMGPEEAASYLPGRQEAFTP